MLNLYKSMPPHLYQGLQVSAYLSYLVIAITETPVTIACLATSLPRRSVSKGTTSGVVDELPTVFSLCETIPPQREATNNRHLLRCRG